MRKQIVALLFALFLAAPFASASKADTSRYIPVNDPIYLNFDNNLDSLLNMWHVSNGPLNKYTPDLNNLADNDLLNIPDSVFINRIAKIPTTVKLSFNNIVRNNINYYLTRRKDKLEEMLGLANFYFPVFDDIFDYYKVPNEMKYMSVIESALNPKAYSRTKAVGLWQFMYGTGKLYGLEVNSWVDERRDLMKSTHAACRFVNDLYKIYGDWILVIAAYNCGPGNVNKAIRRAGGRRNYWDIYYYLPKETRGHVPAFIAATYLMNYYKKHNLVPRKGTLPIAVDTIMINKDLHLMQVSEVLNIPIEELRNLNLQYIKDIIPGSIKTYPLYLPQEYTAQFIKQQNTIFNYKDSIFFDKRYLTHSPGNGPGYESKTNKLSKIEGATHFTHKVRSGETLASIARKYDVSITDLKSWNKIRRKKLVSGQRLTIYTMVRDEDPHNKKSKKIKSKKDSEEQQEEVTTHNKSKETITRKGRKIKTEDNEQDSVVKNVVSNSKKSKLNKKQKEAEESENKEETNTKKGKQSTKETVAKDKKTKKSSKLKNMEDEASVSPETKEKNGKIAKATEKAKSKKVKQGEYTVKQGETLWKISQKLGVKPADLIQQNGIEDNKIKPGQKLKYTISEE
jgi:membrane-bound lytic murein transglycosylase D